MPNALKQMQLQQKEQKRRSLETDEENSTDESETDETTSDLTVHVVGYSPPDGSTPGTESARNSMAGLDDFDNQTVYVNGLDVKGVA
jgi:hypothetical protein